MNRILKLKQTPESKVYFTSDTHFGHNRPFVVEARGYKSIAEHDDAVFAKINEVVRPQDKLVHTGDLCLNTTEPMFEQILSRIQCQNIYHLWGNHNNPVWKVYQAKVRAWLQGMDDDFTATQPKPDIEVYPFTYRNMTFLGNYAEVAVDGHYFVLAHYPLYVFNEMKNGAMMLCGHSHYSLKLSQADDLTSKILDIGWDGHAKPLSVDEILKIMSKKAQAEFDHHTKDSLIYSNERSV